MNTGSEGLFEKCQKTQTANLLGIFLFFKRRMVDSLENLFGGRLGVASVPHALQGDWGRFFRAKA